MSKATTVDEQGRKVAESGPQTEESLKTSKTTGSILPDPANMDVEFEMQTEGIGKRKPKPFDEETIREIITKRVKNASYEPMHDSAPEQVPSNMRDNMREATALLAYITDLEETVAHLQNQATAPHSMTLKTALKPTTGTSSTEQSWNMEVKRWKRIRDNRLDEADLVDDTKPIQDRRRDRQRENNHVLISYREYDKKTPNIHCGTTLEVNSPLLVASLQKAIGQYPGDAFQSLFSDVVAIPEPYVMLFHNRLKIQKEMEMVAGESKEHLQLLLSFLREQLPVASQKLDEMEDEKLVEIGYEEQWLLYPQAALCTQKKMENGESTHAKRLQEEAIRVMIDYSTGSKCPAVNIQKSTYGQKSSHQICSMIDFRSGGVPGCECIDCYVQRGQSAPPGDFVRHEYMQERVTDPESTPECFMFCAAVIMAFSLKDKDWKPVKIHQLSPVSFKEDSFRSLVISKTHKTVVTAMVRSYLSKQHGFNDLIRGKGRGLVVLLHGSPGTGKTLTAECVAEKENRPLYMVTCGDLGTSPDVMEIKLRKIFKYAFNWNAILLLDEADVFLQERDVHDLKRNALVSIFLRHPEYFDGILFLTTNRPGALDEAFQSRIHITLGLPDLDVQSQRKVWGIFVRKLDISPEERTAIMNSVTEDIKRHGNLNGRQIRNTVRAALALALQKGVPVNKDHIRDILEIGRDFTKYMEDVNRMNQEQRAFALGHRTLPGTD